MKGAMRSFFGVSIMINMVYSGAEEALQEIIPDIKISSAGFSGEVDGHKVHLHYKDGDFRLGIDEPEEENETSLDDETSSRDI